MKFWQVAVCFAVGFLLAWLLFGRPAPPPPKVLIETHTDTLPGRVDTVETVPPALLGKLNRQSATIAAFLADTSFKPDTICVRLLTGAGITLDSLRLALNRKPALRLSVEDTAMLKFPIKAFWVGLRYTAQNDTAIETWDYRFYSARPPPKANIGLAFNVATNGEYYYGGQIRVSNSAALQIQKAKSGWVFGGVYFLF